MHFNPAISLRPNILTKYIARTPAPAAPVGVTSREASDEIHSYIAARDMALAEAVQHTSNSTLNRAFLANQLVENCLKPVRSPYQKQSLVENEAAQERKRCLAASARIAQLRQNAATRVYDCAVAA
jgi:hypothetical protein